MKKFKIISYIILLIVLVILALTVYTSATQDNSKDEKEKAVSEIRYLDTKLVDLFNNMNNIEMRNYKIYTTKIEESRSAETTGGGNSSSESGQNSKGTNSDSSSSSGGSNTTNTEKNYEMTESGILTSSRDIDWTACKNEVELIYTSISTITLDLYKQNVTQEDILNFNKELDSLTASLQEENKQTALDNNFNKELDSLTASLQEENKQTALDNLIKIYEYIPRFAQNVSDDTLYKTVLETKLHVFKAYSKLDTKDWGTMATNLTDAINVYSSLLTNTGIETGKQSSINKGYVMLNELKNAVDLQNDSIFLIKYKNLLEEINNL